MADSAAAPGGESIATQGDTLTQISALVSANNDTAALEGLPRSPSEKAVGGREERASAIRRQPEGRGVG